MNDGIHRLTDRRTVLRGAAGAAGLAAAGGLGLLATGSVGAQTENHLTINDVTVSTDEGDLSFVDVATEGFASWDGFDVPVHAIAFEVRIERLDGDGAVIDSHTLFDQRNKDGPVLLENISSKGDGSDGWGGAGEYVDELVVPEDNAFDVVGGYAGHIHSDSNWRYLADSDVATAKSVETVGVFGEDFSELDNETDGSTITHTLQLVGNVHLYTLVANENMSVASETRFGNGRDVYPMGADDGTRDVIHGSTTFAVSVTNEADQTGGEGTATATGG